MMFEIFVLLVIWALVFLLAIAWAAIRVVVTAREAVEKRRVAQRVAANPRDTREAGPAVPEPNPDILESEFDAVQGRNSIDAQRNHEED